VPASPLSLRAGCFPLAEPLLSASSGSVADCLTAAILSDDLLSVVCHDGVEVGCFVHAVIIGTGSGGLGGLVDILPTGRAAASRYKEREAIAPLKYNSCEQQFVRKSAQLHGVAEFSGEEFSAIVEANEPFPVLLKYTFTSDCVLTENSIDAGLGGHRLITTVPKTHTEVTNLCNFVAVKVYSRGLSFRVESNLSVSRLPVDAVRNGGVHLAFNLTHEKWGCLT